MARCSALLSALALVCGFGALASAQGRPEAAADSRTQYPAFLSNSYFGFSVGSINYPFSGRQLESGFQVESVDVHHPAARVVLFGHRFHKYLSAQVGYTRPVQWVSYNRLNGDDYSHSVRIAMGDVSLKSQVPITRRVAGWHRHDQPERLRDR